MPPRRGLFRKGGAGRMAKVELKLASDHLDACGNDGGASRATWLPLPGQDRTGRQTACPKPRAFPLWRHRSGFSTPFLRLDPVGCTVAAPGIQVEHDGLLGLPPR